MADEILDAYKNASSESATVASDREMRVGIIGCGGISRAHIDAYLRAPNVKIVAACDLVPGRAADRMAQKGVEGVKTDYKDHLEMLEDKSLQLDAVSVCTYNRQHVPCAIAALEHGVNVLLEKPLCVTLEEGIELMRAERKSGKVLSIGFQPRFDENMKMIKKIVQSGELGKVYYIQTGGGRRRGIPVGNECSFIREDTAGVGALGDIGCYSLDLVLNALDYPKPLTVTGYKSDFFGKSLEHWKTRSGARTPEEVQAAFGVDDFAAAFVRLEGGVILDFRISWAMNMDTPGDTIILGTKGGLRVPSTDCWNGTIPKPLKIYHEVAGMQTVTEIPLIPNGALSYWDHKIRTFLDAARTNGKPPVSIDQIIYNQAIVSGIVKSSELGREIEIEIPEL